jgi:hypothetical protein
VERSNGPLNNFPQGAWPVAQAPSELPDWFTVR